MRRIERAWRLRLQVALLALFLPLLLQAAIPRSEPPDIAALRNSESRSAEELRQQAIALRDASDNRAYRAWANLALAEFDNDLEHADVALTTLEEVFAEARALQLRDLEFETLGRKATILVNRGRSEETEAVLAQAKQLVDASDDAGWRAQWLHNRGVLERKLGRFAEAESYFQQSLTLLRELDDRRAVARELNSIGMLHGRTGRFSDALLVHKEALALAREAADPGEIARSLRLLGVLHRNLDDEELGSRYLKEALEYVEERNTREAITLLGELTKSLLLLERVDEAEQSATQAASMAERSGSPPNRVSAYTRMAEVRMAQGRLEEASQWTDRAFESFDAVAIRDQILLRLTRAQVQAARGQAAAALVEAAAVVEATRKVGDRILERAALGLLADQQLLAGDAASAFVTLKSYQALDKELAIDLAARRIAMLEGSLENERSQAEKALLERDNAVQALTLNRQRWLGIGLIVGVAGLIALATLLFRRFRAAEQRRRQISASRDELARLHRALLDSSSELERVAHSDALTGLANRHALAGELTGRLASAQTSGKPLSALILDVDFFKQLNDRHGHLAGDAALREIASRLRKALRGDSALGRWGGEEFLAILSDCSHEDALAAAERLRRAIADTPFSIGDKSLAITASIGVATTHAPHPASIDPLLATADDALYRAKRGGRNRVEGEPMLPAAD
jgi:diguanylate cyclase (GGDEF)-like protein